MRTRLLSVGLLVALAAVLAGTAYTVNRSTRAGRSAPQTTGVVSGRVVAPDGEPVAKAQVYALSDRQSGRLPIFLTDEQGMFSITGLIPDVYKIHAEKEEDDYPPTYNLFYSAGLVEVPQVTITDDDAGHDVTVYLGPKAIRLEGRIIDAAKNAPIRNLQGVQLKLRREDGSPYTYMTGPDLEGNFSILVPEAAFTIEVSAPGYEEKHLPNPRVRAGQLNRLDIPLRPAR
jgi:hypothetical protein